ncbi:MAG: class I SAM-dependent methyltransferase [Algisphaera sp.]
MLSPPLSHWQAAAANTDLLAQASLAKPGNINAIARLRRNHAHEHVAVALDLTRARDKAQIKFPACANTLMADPAGVEQASSYAVATHKAQRFIKHKRAQVIDLCCGIGGDTMALHHAGLNTIAVDHDPVRAWMANQNANAPAVVADAATWHSPSAALHIDPARRTHAGRTHRLADTLPAPDVVSQLIARHAQEGVAVKLSPAIDRTELAEQLPPGELEFISESGRLVQAVLWTGGLTTAPPGVRRATRITANAAVHSLHGVADQPAWSEPKQFLFTVDPGLERASLMHLIGLPAIHPKLGLLTADDDPQSPWLTGFELLEQMPWREKKVRRTLAALDAGVVEVKTRGKAVDPDQAQRALRGTGKTPFTVFVLRWDRQVVALITRRLLDAKL